MRPSPFHRVSRDDSQTRWTLPGVISARPGVIAGVTGSDLAVIRESSQVVRE
jgi:hypothetical protein